MTSSIVQFWDRGAEIEVGLHLLQDPGRRMRMEEVQLQDMNRTMTESFETRSENRPTILLRKS